MRLEIKVLLTAVVCSCGLVAGNDFPQALVNWIGPDALLLRLDKLLDACIANYEFLTTDLLLGVAIANGQVKSILSNSKVANRPFIETLQKKCDFVESRIDSIFSFPSEANAIVSKVLINSDFWQNSVNTDSKTLEYRIKSDRYRLRARRHHTLRDYLLTIDDGSPTELQSDQCLSELLVNSSENEFNSTLAHGKQLLLSPECAIAMSVRSKSYGYRLTHKVLFYIVLSRQQFSNVEESFVQDANDRLCGQILREARLIEVSGYPDVLRDLFMEQIFLCALAGYDEFRSPKWLTEIVSWQNQAGCFKSYDLDLDVGSNQLSANCSSHMTGVGAAVLGLFARLQLMI
ncbi:uncharacterized protein LOC128741093 [Sabethes cyaneus]|uniref:uncharacterized protein LOC128741093 n=1 Tax=Sabethes cyaneus TaxID=53552 RepID=UPI00237D9572|nr:uncharacterized protein LOC128741093 [Sabethes cyaneus]